MMLRSSRPLVVFEGKTDVMYVKRALEMLKSRVTDYASLNVDFLNANGAGNVKSFIDNLKAFVPDSKKIVVFFDRDNAGKDGVQAITGISKNDGRVAHYQDIVQDNITMSSLRMRQLRLPTLEATSSLEAIIRRTVLSHTFKYSAA